MVVVNDDKLDKSMDEALDDIAGFFGEEIYPFGVTSFIEKFFPDLHKEKGAKNHMYSFNMRDVSILVSINEFSEYKEIDDRTKEFGIVFCQPC